ncbi:MAG TPA: nitroreductase family deazaflavin-dependent oxidoreductase [Solirubrobacterales bacterium]|nr:nitroreductase family deazaflavin-dependent oxidoreductase [Solirubrobacterales bacterium]
MWPALNRVAGLQTFLYKVSGGRVANGIPGFPEVRGKLLLLDHVGAKSRKKRTSPLLYFRDGANVVLVASKGGFPKHPAWYHNLMVNPETKVQIGSERLRVHARAADPEERERLWPLAVQTYKGYADYQARSKGREIPLVILEPRPA